MGFFDSVGNFFSGVGDFLGITGDGSSSPGGGIPGLWDRYKNGQTNTYNERMNTATNQANKDIAEQNLQFQRENLDYQKALQERIFQREDSAYARTVSDMRQAGISPLVMQGTNGAGEAIATQPLHNEMQYQKNYRQNSGSPIEALNFALSLASGIESLKQQRLNNKFMSDTLNDRVSAYNIENSLKQADLVYKNYENADKGRKVDYNHFFGINDSMTPDERRAAIVNKMFNFNDYSEYDNKFFGDKYTNHQKSYGKVYSGLQAGGSILDLLKGLF